MATAVTLPTYSDLQATVPVMGSYYLEWTGNEALQWAAHYCQKAIVPDMRLVHYDAANKSQWIDPSRRLIDQGVRHGDRIALYSAAPGQTQIHFQAAYQPQPQPQPQPQSQSNPEEKCSIGSTFRFKSQNRDYKYVNGGTMSTIATHKANFNPRSFTPTNPVMHVSPQKLDSLIVKITDFEKIENIGSGAFGRLYRARDRKTGKEYAVKILTNNLDDPNERKMFMREVEILASLDHPCLLSLRGFVPYQKKGDEAAIITEYMKGGSLQAVINKEAKGTPPPGWDDTHKLIVLYGVAVGMYVLRSKRIIHRDLKPDNILLNENFEPKVADFGMSKFVEKGATMYQTVQGGTAIFMAPEIYEGDSYDYSVDVYAYGMLVYCTLTGITPFSDCATPFLISQKVCKGERPPIPSYINESWRALIEACWDQSPAQRPSFEQIVTELASVNFATGSVNPDVFRKYQEKVRIPNELILKAAPRAQDAPPPEKQKSSLEMLIEAAESGDPNAMYEYALRLQKGEGVEKDEKKAFELFKKAAGKDHGAAMVSCGLCLKDGEGCDKNFKESASWFKKALDKGVLDGYYWYATMLENDLGVTRNYKEAERLFRIAADAGHPRAQAHYGLALEMQYLGLKRNIPESVRYYKMSSDQGSLDGIYYYADMLENGKGVKEDTKEALRLYTLAADKGHLPSIAYVAVLMIHGKIMEKNVQRGLAALKEAGKRGCTIAYLHLGKEYESGKYLPKNLPKALRKYQKAMLGGSTNGFLHYARCQKEGIGCEADPGAAANVYRLLISVDENRDAYRMLGLMYLVGDGVECDPKKGLGMIQKAAELGDLTAQRALEDPNLKKVLRLLS